MFLMFKYFYRNSQLLNLKPFSFWIGDLFNISNFLYCDYALYYLLMLVLTITVAAMPHSVCLWWHLLQVIVAKLHLCIVSLSCFKTISHKNKVWFSRGTLVCCFQSGPATMAPWIGNKGPSCWLVVYSMPIASISKMASHGCLFTTNT